MPRVAMSTDLTKFLAVFNKKHLQFSVKFTIVLTEKICYNLYIVYMATYY